MTHSKFSHRFPLFNDANIEGARAESVLAMSNSERDYRISRDIKILLIEMIIRPMIREMEEINFRFNVLAFIHMIEDVDELVFDEKWEFRKFRRNLLGFMWLFSDFSGDFKLKIESNS